MNVVNNLYLQFTFKIFYKIYKFLYWKIILSTFVFAKTTDNFILGSSEIVFIFFLWNTSKLLFGSKLIPSFIETEPRMDSVLAVFIIFALMLWFFSIPSISLSSSTSVIWRSIFGFCLLKLLNNSFKLY